MRSIKDDLAYAMQVAEFTGDKLDDRLVKAFRAKEFGRCPKCDSVALIGWRDLNHTQTIKCQSCGAVAVLEDDEIMTNYKDSGYYMSDAYALLVVDKMTQ